MNNQNFGRMTGNQMLPRRMADGGLTFLDIINPMRPQVQPQPQTTPGGFTSLEAPKSGSGLYTFPGQSNAVGGIPMPFSRGSDYYARSALPVDGDPATAAFRPGQLYFQYGAPGAKASPMVETFPAAGGLPADPSADPSAQGGLYDATAQQFEQSQGRAGDGPNTGERGGKATPGVTAPGDDTGLGPSWADVGKVAGTALGLAVGMPGLGLLGGKLGAFADPTPGNMSPEMASEIASAASAENADVNAAIGADGYSGGVGADTAGRGDQATGADPDGGEAYRRGGHVKRYAQGGLAVVANQVRDASTVPGSGLAYLSPDMQRTVTQLKDPQMNPSSGVPQYARGGLSAAGHNGPGYVGNKEPGGTGRSDGVPAMLSNNEYVVDAETTALLGDGNPAAGAKKLDAMRENIRKHKGKALAKGKISQDAKPAEGYMRGGLPTKGGK